MYYALFILISSLYSCSEQLAVEGLLKNYELVDCHVFSSRMKRSSLHAEESDETGVMEIRFSFESRVFHVLLHEDASFRTVEIVTRGGKDGTERFKAKSRVYDGVIKDCSTFSRVNGYFHDGVFSGTVETENLIYFVEPAQILLSDYSYFPKVAVYKDDDVIFKADERVRPVSLHNSTQFFQKRQLARRDTSAQPLKDYACEVEMVADHTLFELFDRDVQSVSAFLYAHAKHADSIFRETDFDEDGLSDGIRIIVGKITIFSNASDPDYPMAHSEDLPHFLADFSLRSTEYCLSICICARSYPSFVIGQAYRAHANDFEPGGICQGPTPYFGNKRNGKFMPFSLNTAVLTIKNSNTQTLPQATSLYALAHELGHAFGSHHDDPQDVLCSPGGRDGFYLMYPKTSDPQKPLKNLFSPCSRRDIQRILNVKSECLKYKEPVCGNGIREGHEDCDCGPKEVCDQVDPCCTPPSGSKRDCTFRKNSGAVCSHKENRCCSRSCQIDTGVRAPCYDSGLCMVSFCESSSGSCPIAKSAPDSHPCQMRSKTCQKGKCNSTICRDNGLKDCMCKKGYRDECLACCLKGNRCTPAAALGFRSPDGREYVRMPGSKCRDGKFECNGSGQCLSRKERMKEESDGETMSPKNWWIVSLLGTVIVILFLFLLWTLKKNLSET